MLSILKNSLDHIFSILTPSLYLLFLIAVFCCIKKCYWRKSSLHLSLAIIIILMIGWRFLMPLASSRYFAIIILPAIFLAAFLWGQTCYRKWTYSWFIVIAAIIMLGKDFRYTSEDYHYCEIAAVVRENRPWKQNSIFVTLANDYNKYFYVLKDMGIDLLDLSRENSYTKDSMLHQQLLLNYDRVYVADKCKKKTQKETIKALEFKSILYRHPIGRKKEREILVFQKAGIHSSILPKIEELLPLLTNEFMDDFTELVPEKQRELIRQRLVSQGFTQFRNMDFELPENWIPDIYAGSTGKERVFITTTPERGMHVRTPQSLAMVYKKRMTITEDYYAIADVTAITPVELQLGTFNYSSDAKTFEGAIVHGLQSVVPGRRRRVVFLLDYQALKGKSINIRWGISNGEVEIHRLYLFPCRRVGTS